MKLTDEQQEALEAVKFNARIDWQTWRQLDTNAHDFAYLDGYDDGYAAAYASLAREIEELRQFVADIEAVDLGVDLIVRWDDADGSFVLFEEDNPVSSVTGSDAFDVWRKWKQEDV